MPIAHDKPIALQALAESVLGAVPHADLVDGNVLAQIDFPPGVLVIFLAVGQAFVGVDPARVAVDAAAGDAPVRRARLGRLALPGDIDAVRKDLDLGQRQRARIARQIDPDESTPRPLVLAHLLGEIRRQPVEQGRNLVVGTGTQLGVRD